MTAHWPPGVPAWVGADCLVPEVVQVDTGPTHRTRCVATYDHATSTSLCPECGAVVAWSAEPSQWADPRCRECQGRESCPPTPRDGRAGGVGGETTPAIAGGEG